MNRNLFCKGYIEYTILVSKEYISWLPEVIQIARNASLAIMEFYQKKDYQIKTKDDQSPVTEADILAHEMIEQGLSNIDPNLPIISEEGSPIAYSERCQWPLYWLVDPLDGTREFIKGTGEFTVNIALIENHRPVLGVVIAPALQQSYWAVQGGQSFFQEAESEPVVLKCPSEFRYPVKIALSRNHHTEDVQLLNLLKCLDQKVEIYYYGSALKICLVARNKVDLYPRFGRTGEWDTAAGQCVLEVAGGQLVDVQGQPLRYNTHATLFNPGFYAVGCKSLLPCLLSEY